MMRVDVFSAKGGVGKTTVAFRLAHTWAKKSDLPVLLVDADLSGTCLGDLLEPSAYPGWQEQRNLIHLVCGRPEALPEELAPARLPVYELRSNPDEYPQRVRADASGATLLFCPSNAETYLKVSTSIDSMVDLTVLQALLGHESAGGWVGHVIERVIAATRKFVSVGISAVIVDHGPGISALQWSQMSAIEDELSRACKAKSTPSRQALFVASRDMVDLAAARAIDDRIGPARSRHMGHIRSNALWVLNRLPADWKPSSNGGPHQWRTELEEMLSTTHLDSIQHDAWFINALPVFEDPALARAYANSGLPAYWHTNSDHDIADIYDRLTRSTAPKAAL
ncbi:P-loop NTPase [Sorangium sp. So ce233]|uniref:P-loop NTPase n=1 Tax=Sorangium sp. So ce233 TaxID=3133290 RepID=UPI003F600104